jgi:predicted N-acetyltransferase YhbS
MRACFKRGRNTGMIQIRHERSADIDAREALLDQAFGETRYRKSSERLREDRLPADGLSFIASEGKRVIGTARLWNIACGNSQPALLLGPVAVAEDCRGRGLGGALVCRAIQTARKLGHGAIVLVGDPEYYSRFGFSGEKTGALWMPGPFERHRLLGRELKAGSLNGARGMIAPTGRLEPMPDLAALVAREAATAAPVSRVRGSRPRAA